MADHKAHHQEFAEAGYRLNSLSVYGPWWNTRVAAIWQKRGDGAGTWGAYYHEFAAVRDARRQEQLALGRTPRLVAVFNDACGVPRYSEVFEEPDGQLETSYTLFDQPFPPGNNWQGFRFKPFKSTRNYLPRWLCLHEAPQGCPPVIVWSGVFESRKGNRTVPWNVTVDSAAGFRTTYEAMIQAPGVRPEVIALAPDVSTIATVWRGEYTDETLVPFEPTFVLEKDELEAKLVELEGLGYYPVRAHATSHWFDPYWDEEPVFIVVFARGRKGLLSLPIPGKKPSYPDMAPLEQHWTVTGKPESPHLSVQQVDAYMQELMTLVGAHGGQVAVADGDQLKLLRAYTLAPSGYPITQPVTRFPLGSVSKGITGAAILLLWMKLKELELLTGDPRAFNLGLTSSSVPNISIGGIPVIDHPETLLQDRLEARAFDGFVPRDLRFRNELTIRHCCTHTGGWLTNPGGFLFDWGQADASFVMPAVQKASFDEAAVGPQFLFSTLPSPQPPTTTQPTKARVYPPDLIEDALKYTLDLPVQPGQLEAYLATVDGCIEFVPGKKPGYSGTGPFLLGQVVARLGGEDPQTQVSYADWSSNWLFETLAVPAGRARPVDALPPPRENSALTHDGVPRVWLSVNHPAPQPTVPSIQGGNLVLAHTNGAWVAPAADIVRFFASFSRTPHPIYAALADPAGTLFNSPKKNVSFFWYTYNLPDRTGQNVKTRQHNGAIVGGNALAFRRDDGLAVVITLNQSIPPVFDAGGVFQKGALRIEKHGVDINALLNQIPLAIWNAITPSEVDWSHADIGPWP